MIWNPSFLYIFCILKLKLCQYIKRNQQMNDNASRTNAQNIRNQLKLNLFGQNRVNKLFKDQSPFKEKNNTPQPTKLSQINDSPIKSTEIAVRKKPYLLKSFEQLYDIGHHQLGQGAHAVVKQCWRKNKPEKVYAVKIFRTGDPEIVNTIIETFNNNRMLNSGKGIIKAYDLFIDESKEISHLVMEYCDYPSLEWASLDREDIRKFVFKITETLKFIHGKGICHRDLKPDNILINLDEKYNEIVDKQFSHFDIKIIDFGVSKKFVLKSKESQNFKLRDMWTRTGTLLYSAPEIFEGGGYNQKGFPLDMWSVGVMLYQLLTNKMPYQNDTLMGTIDEILNKTEQYENKAEFQKLDFLEKDLLRRLLQKDPAKRLCCEESLLHPWICQAYQKNSKSTNDDSHLKKPGKDLVRLTQLDLLKMAKLKSAWNEKINKGSSEEEVTEMDQKQRWTEILSPVEHVHVIKKKERGSLGITFNIQEILNEDKGDFLRADCFTIKEDQQFRSSSWTVQIEEQG